MKREFISPPQRKAFPADDVANANSQPKDDNESKSSLRPRAAARGVRPARPSLALALGRRFARVARERSTQRKSTITTIMTTNMNTSILPSLLKRLAPAMSALLLTTVLTVADTHIWTGAGTTGYWSDTHNWDNATPPSVGEMPPVVLRFPAMALQTFNTNDIAGLTIHQMRLDRAGYLI